MNQLITYNQSTDIDTHRRYAGFPLNSTLISSYSPDRIRNIINHAVTGKPYTTAVWIRISSVGIQISAQDPQIARTRIPVFIPIGFAHDIFMQPNINNVICIVYDEIKSNMKGVLLYVIHPSDANSLREDFRIAKQASILKGIDNQIIIDKHIKESNRLFPPIPQHPTNEIFLNGTLTRQQSPRRILYVRDNNIGLNTDYTSSSIAPGPLPQLSYTPFKGSYHSSSRENSTTRRHKSPRKTKAGYSSTKIISDSGSRQRSKYRSRSPAKSIEPEPSENKSDHDTVQEENNQQPQQQQTQSVIAWQAAQQTPMIRMGIYNRYVPKTIPLPTGEMIKTTLQTSNANGIVVAHVEPQQNNTNPNDSNLSIPRSRSISPKRLSSQQHNRNKTVANGEESGTVAELLQKHHHHHHHHRRQQTNGNRYSSSKADSIMYNTISHSFRSRSNCIPRINNHTDSEAETKQYLKQLIDEMQTMKLEMNKIRLASSSTGTKQEQSDSLRLNIKELRSDIDSIRARISLASKVSK